MKYLILLLILSLTTLNTYSQNIDSLKIELKNHLDEDVRLKILDQITYYYFDNASKYGYNVSQKYLDEAIKLSEYSKNSFYRYVFLIRKAYLLKIASRYEEGIKAGDEGYALALKHKDFNMVHTAGYVMAMLYTDANYYPSAQKQIISNIKYLKQFPNSKYIRANYLLLSALSNYVNNDLLYEYYLKKGNEYLKENIFHYRLNYEFPIVKLLYLNKTHEAKELLKKYLSEYPIKDLEVDKIYSYMNLVRNLTLRNEYDIAETLVNQLLKLELNSYPLEESIILSYKVKIEIQKGNFELARSLNEKILKAKTPVFKKNILAVENQVYIDNYFGNKDEALKHSKYILSIKDSILYNNNVVSYMMISTLDEIDSLKIDYEQQRLENTLQKNRLKKLLNLKWVLYILLFLLFALCLLLIYMLKELKYKKDKLERQKQVLKEKIDKFIN